MFSRLHKWYVLRSTVLCINLLLVGSTTFKQVLLLLCNPFACAAIYCLALAFHAQHYFLQLVLIVGCCLVFATGAKGLRLSYGRNLLLVTLNSFVASDAEQVRSKVVLRVAWLTISEGRKKGAKSKKGGRVT